jgi:replication initiation protein RepC
MNARFSLGRPERSADKIMDSIMSSPVPRHVRRTISHCLSDRGSEKRNNGTADTRWSLLDLVRRSRSRLGVRDRDIAVLRGLLSLVPSSAAPSELVVFASNRVLIERCDGIDERTLRRRLEHLIARGLITRRSSPNGKRYQVRDDYADVRLTYGIDLSPLFAIRDHLTALAEQCLRDEMRCKALRSVIRDILYHHAANIQPELTEQAYRSLRRSLSNDQLEEIVAYLHAELPPAKLQDASITTVLSASDSQNDRHIQRSNKENYESEDAEEATSAEPFVKGSTGQQSGPGNDITVRECMVMAKNAAAFTSEPPRDWNDVVRLSAVLAPAIGLEDSDVDIARRAMGPLGCALAILGMVESYEKIRNPRAYLRALTIRACGEGLNFVRMFRSLTSVRVAGLQVSYAS